LELESAQEKHVKIKEKLQSHKNSRRVFMKGNLFIIFLISALIFTTGFSSLGSQDNNELNQKINDLESEISRLKSDFFRLEIKQSDSDKKISDLEDEVSRLRSEIADVQQ